MIRIQSEAYISYALQKCNREQKIFLNTQRKDQGNSKTNKLV